jgi:hypothetical protein
MDFYLGICQMNLLDVLLFQQVRFAHNLACLCVPGHPAYALAYAGLFFGSHGVAPVPESSIICGEPLALSVATRLAVSAPEAVGLNAIDRVQLAPAASDVPHVLPFSRKAVALVPVKV